MLSAPRVAGRLHSQIDRVSATRQGWAVAEIVRNSTVGGVDVLEPVLFRLSFTLAEDCFKRSRDARRHLTGLHQGGAYASNSK